MPRVLTDSEIDALLAEKKPLPDNWVMRLRPRPKSNQSYKHRSLELEGEEGHTFRIILRQNELHQFDFSIVLMFVDVDGPEYRLVRLNGRHSSQHTNKLEKRKNMADSTFRNRFHIHRATERYQLAGLDIDGYAEPTDDYDSFESALKKFIMSNGLTIPPAPEPDEPLFVGDKGDET